MRELPHAAGSRYYYSLADAARVSELSALTRLPFSLRVLAENLLRHADTPWVESGMLARKAERMLNRPFRLRSGWFD